MSTSDFPSELVSNCCPLIGFAGLELSNEVHKNVWESFSNRKSDRWVINPFIRIYLELLQLECHKLDRWFISIAVKYFLSSKNWWTKAEWILSLCFFFRPSIQFKLIPSNYEFPTAKPKRQSYEWYSPKYILKRNWMLKHTHVRICTHYVSCIQLYLCVTSYRGLFVFICFVSGTSITDCPVSRDRMEWSQIFGKTIALCFNYPTAEKLFAGSSHQISNSITPKIPTIGN